MVFLLSLHKRKELSSLPKYFDYGLSNAAKLSYTKLWGEVDKNYWGKSYCSIRSSFS